MIPLEPNWPTIVTTLYAHYKTYDKLLDAMGSSAATDHSTLCKIRSGKVKRPCWPTGAALLNLYAQLRSRSGTAL